MHNLPKYPELIAPLLEVLKNAGKPLSNDEIEASIIIALQIPESLSTVIRSGKRTELQYRLAWAKTRAKSEGLIKNPQSKTWIIA